MYTKVSYDRVCEYCGKEFVAHDKRQRFCSKRYKDISCHIRKGRKRNTNTEPFHKECVICGKPYDTFREASITCSSECAKKYHNKSKSIKKRKEPIQKNCVICGKTYITNRSYQVICGSKKCRNERNKQPKRIIYYEMRECAEFGSM